MASAVVLLNARVIPVSRQARLLCSGLPTLVLPWWPSEIEHSGFAPTFSETERPGRTPLVRRSSTPLPGLRIAYVASGPDLNVSMKAHLALVRKYCDAKPLVQLMLGASDRGRFVITEGGAVESEWASNGDPSVADVILMLREAMDSTVAIGPILSKSKRAR